MNIQPNLFVIGAMRCGTTTLHLLFDQHPDIFMSPVKEPMFYAAESIRRDLDQADDRDTVVREKLESLVAGGRHREKLSYSALFKNHRTEKLVGESSHYLYVPSTAQVIFQDCPSANIVCSVREPVERLYSEYLLYRRTGKRLDSFYEFVVEDCTVNSNGGIKRVGKASRLRKGCYAELLKPWLDVFGGERLNIVLFDRLMGNPLKTVQSVYRWLGVDSTFRPTIVKAQQGGISRFRLLTLLDRPSKFRRGVSRVVPKMLKERVRSGLYEAALRKDPIDPSVKRILRDFYEPGIVALEEMLKIDLDCWRK